MLLATAVASTRQSTVLPALANRYTQENSTLNHVHFYTMNQSLYWLMSFMHAAYTKFLTCASCPGI